MTDIANDGARFSVMVAALIGARISLSIGAVAAMKVRLIGGLPRDGEGERDGRRVPGCVEGLSLCVEVAPALAQY